jgi:ribosomal protein S18 acetylase RimI-like enzyme
MNVLGLLKLGMLKLPIVFGLQGMRKIIRISNEWENLQKKEPKRHWYLLAIGVDPANQGKGIGSQLLKTVLCEADKSQLPCYLETMTEIDVQFYRKQGFEIAHEGLIDGRLPYWTMRRSPK